MHQTRFAVEGNHKKEFDSYNAKISNKDDSTNSRSDISVFPITKKHISEADSGVEDKLRLILERMDRQELKWDLKFESLKYNHKAC